MMQIEKTICLTLDKRLQEGLEFSRTNHDAEALIDCPIDMFLVGHGQLNAAYDHIDVMKPPMAPFHYGSPTTINNHYNAFLCHRKMAQRCIDERVDNCLFLEDDAYFTSYFDMIWPTIADELELLEWDIVYLGWWMERPNTSDSFGERFDFNERWNEKNEFGLLPVPRKPEIKQEICGLHGLLVNETMFPIMANAPWGPMDSYLTTQLDRIKAYCVWPKIIHVGPGFSYCEQSYANRVRL